MNKAIIKKCSTYDCNLLYVGKLIREIKTDDYRQLSVEITNQFYLFEKIIDGDVTRYKEVFTGFIVNEKKDEIGSITSVYKLIDCIPEVANKKYNKIDLMWIQNDINYIKEGKKKRKTITVTEVD